MLRADWEALSVRGNAGGSSSACSLLPCVRPNLVPCSIPPLLLPLLLPVSEAP